MMKYVLPIIVLIFVIYTSIETWKKTDRFSEKTDKLIKSRGHSWIHAQGIPDSIYFIHMNNDTTWYFREEKKKCE